MNSNTPNFDCKLRYEVLYKETAYQATILYYLPKCVISNVQVKSIRFAGRLLDDIHCHDSRPSNCVVPWREISTSHLTVKKVITVSDSYASLNSEVERHVENCKKSFYDIVYTVKNPPEVMPDNYEGIYDLTYIKETRSKCEDVIVTKNIKPRNAIYRSYKIDLPNTPDTFVSLSCAGSLIIDDGDDYVVINSQDMDNLRYYYDSLKLQEGLF